MKNKIVSDYNGLTYKRLTKPSARKAFDSGYTICVMTNDRDPISSLTGAAEYTIENKLCFSHNQIAKTFDDVLDDFANWQEYDGYGHIPDTYRARKKLFSYWIKIII